MTTAPTPILSRGVGFRARGEPARQLRWFGAACAVGFLVPFLFADVLDVPRDAYYAIYVVAVFGLFAAWLRDGGFSLRAVLARNLWWALLLGAGFGALLARIVWTYAGTAHPHGVSFAGAILWRGVVYGAADGLLLGALPVLVVFAAFPFRRGRENAWRTVGTGALALAAAFAVTAVYHLGYSDFRGAKLGKPLRGAAIWTAPTLLTLNPLGSVVAHATQHVAAVVHSYDGDTYLPPHAGSSSAFVLRSCTVGRTAAECGVLRVPVNPSEPTGATLPLKVVVFRATGDHPKPDPVFSFAGWGGAGASDDAPNYISAFTAVNLQRDLVFIDQRGTGSSALYCDIPESEHLDAAAVTAAARSCAKRIGPNLRYYTTAVAVDDFDRVRRALGYDRINLYGGSYGPTLEQVYMLRHGAHVRSVVLDSGSLLDVRIFEQEGPNSQQALDLLFARCEVDPACHAAYPDVRAEFARLRARLARTPMPVPGTTQKLDDASLASIVEEMLTNLTGKAQLPRLIHLVATGRIAAAAKLAPPPSFSGPQLAYMMVIECSEPWASWRPAATAAAARGTFMAPVQALNVRLAAAECRGFPRAPVPASIGRRVHSATPVLILSGSEDPADPPRNVAHARRELPNSLTVVFPGSGHGQLSYPCAQTLIADFVDRGSTRGLDTNCAQFAALSTFDTRR